MKLGVAIEEYQFLETHLNLRTDMTGSLAKMLSTMSCGRWFPCLRHCQDETQKAKEVGRSHQQDEEEKVEDNVATERPKQKRLLKISTFLTLLYV